MTTPIQIDASYWYKILNYYQDILAEKFLNMPLTPLIQHQMQEMLYWEQKRSQETETHPAWSVPLKLTFDFVNHQAIVEPDDPNYIELV